ncbi:MAG: GNAT family N-acetyltransferase [Lachnospiraceae bacterium]|nr:GNAT family N-acetyltransferase [Lachnospiraceae bacterium]
MLIRKASGTEMLELWKYPDVNTAPPTARYFYNKIETGNAVFWTVENEGELIGELYVFYNLDDKDFADGKNTAYLCAFRIREDFRGKGIGTGLLREVLARLKAAGFTRATIGVGPEEERNIKLYRNQGFVTKIKDCYFDPCAVDDNMLPKPDEGFWLLAKEL